MKGHTITHQGHAFRVIYGRFGAYTQDDRNTWGFTPYPRGWERLVRQAQRRYAARKPRYRRPALPSAHPGREGE